MTKRIVAIALIFICTSIAWAILGGTIFSRTYDSASSADNRVASTWGAPQDQALPNASFTVLVPKKEESTENGKKIIKTTQEEVTTQLPLESSAIDVNLDLEHRQKGLLWYSTYKVAFSGVYGFRNTSDKEQLVEFTLPFPTTQAIYDDLTFLVDGVSVPIVNENNAATGSVKIPAGKTAQLTTGYRSQGLNQWRYSFGSKDVTQVRDFTLNMKTNFKDIDFPDNTLSPSTKHETAAGWDLTWSYKNLLSGYQIAMVMPEKLQPGPLAGKISFFAPVSLFFFFFLMFIITTMRGIDLHPMNYFFPGGGLFLFPPLARLSGRSRLNPRGFWYRFGCFRLSGSQLSQARRRHAFREQRSGGGPVRLPRDVLLRLFPQRIHGPGNNYRFGYHLVCSNAGDRAYSLDR